jgi:hypothetical protein
MSNSVTPGQDAAKLNASATDVIAPGYGVMTRYSGGTTAGRIFADSDSRQLFIFGGGAGTKSSLSQSSSLSVFE